MGRRNNGNSRNKKPVIMRDLSTLGLAAALGITIVYSAFGGNEREQGPAKQSVSRDSIPQGLELKVLSSGQYVSGVQLAVDDRLRQKWQDYKDVTMIVPGPDEVFRVPLEDYDFKVMNTKFAKPQNSVNGLTLYVIGTNKLTNQPELLYKTNLRR